MRTPLTLPSRTERALSLASVGKSVNGPLAGGDGYRCSLVMLTKNGGDLFRHVVDGLRTQTCWKNVEFIVVDSGSTDETISVAHSAGAIVHTIPPNEFNHGDNS